MNMTIPKSSYSSALIKAHKITCIYMKTSKKLHAGRKSSAINMEVAGRSDHHIKKMLNHAETDTTKNHYGNAPPMPGLFVVAGFCKNGSNYDVMHTMARDKLDSEFIDLVYAVNPWYKEAFELYFTKQAGCDHTKRQFIELAGEAARCLVESAAQFRIQEEHSELEIYSHYPFNSEQFNNVTLLIVHTNISK